jgi:hypothetical protein
MHKSTPQSPLTTKPQKIQKRQYKQRHSKSFTLKTSTRNLSNKLPLTRPLHPTTTLFSPSSLAPLTTSLNRLFSTNPSVDNSNQPTATTTHDRNIITPVDLSQISNLGQLGQHFRSLALSAQTPEQFQNINQQFNALINNPNYLKQFPKLPPTVYCSLLESNLASNDYTQVNNVLLHSINKKIRLPSNTLINTFKQLSIHGQVDALEQALSTIHSQIQQPISNPAPTTTTTTTITNSPTIPPSNPNVVNISANQLLDPQTATQLKESLILSYVNKSRLQDSVHALVQNFGPGSGSIPSDHVIDVIVKNLLRFNRPRHAKQLLSKFDVYCSPKVKSKLYSRVALNFLDTNMPEQLNNTLAYMEQNDISPHPTMMESLLAHIVESSNPLVSLKWYSQVYGKYQPQNQQIEGGEFTQNNNSQQQNQNFNLKAANTILQSLFSINHHHQSLDFIQTLPIHISTINILLKSQLQNKDWDSMRLTLKYMHLRGLPLDQQGLHILIQSLAYHTNPAALTTLLDTLTLTQGLKLHPWTYTLFVKSLKMQGFPKLCELVLIRMIAFGEQPDQSMYTLVMQSYLEQGLLREAFRIKNFMEQPGNTRIRPNLYTYSILLDSLIKKGEALSLYHILTEMFDNADVLLDTKNNKQLESDEDEQGVNPDGQNPPLTTEHPPDLQNSQTNSQIHVQNFDFSRIAQTAFPKMRQFLQQTQSDPTLNQKQRFLSYLRSYVRATCRLLTLHGYKQHSETLANFYLNSGGSILDMKLSKMSHKNLQFSSSQNSNNNPSSPSSDQHSSGSGSVNPSTLLGLEEYDEQIDNISVNIPVNNTMHQYNNQNDNLSSLHNHNLKQQNQFGQKNTNFYSNQRFNFWGNKHLTDHEFDESIQSTNPNKLQTGPTSNNVPQSDPFTSTNRQQLRIAQYTADNSTDAIYDQLDTNFDIEEASKNPLSLPNSNSIITTILDSTSPDANTHTTTHFDPFSVLHDVNIMNRTEANQALFNLHNQLKNTQKMFNVDKLHRLPGNSLNDYIDRADSVLMHTEQDRVLRAGYQNLLSPRDPRFGFGQNRKKF